MRSRVGVLLCLLAFALQLADQAVHMWEVATERGVVVSNTPTLPLPLGSVQRTTALSAADNIPQRAPHNPILCSVCQALSRLQVCMVMQSWTTGTSGTGSWLTPFWTEHVCNLSLSAAAPRAPPALS